MSGGSEANFELGWAVNVDSHVTLLKATHAHAKKQNSKPLYVFVSSLAVYGGPKCLPESYVKPQDTPVVPQTSYGVQKHIIELYAYDYGRKGESRRLCLFAPNRAFASAGCRSRRHTSNTLINHQDTSTPGLSDCPPWRSEAEQ